MIISSFVSNCEIIVHNMKIKIIIIIEIISQNYFNCERLQISHFINVFCLRICYNHDVIFRLKSH